MKKLLITLLLISPFSFADWDDVYYCQMTSNSTLTINGVRRDKTPERFHFKLDKEKQAMVFGKGGLFSGATLKVTDKTKYAPETWFSETTYERSHFLEGRFLYSLIIPIDISTVTANCETF